MTQNFILGLRAAVPNSALLDTNTLYDLAGHNTGNLAFHYAIEQHIQSITTVVSWESDVATINNSGTTAIVPCANQVGDHADQASLSEKFKCLDVRLVAVGLGAQSGTNAAIPEVPEGTLEWIRQIAKRTPNGAANIGVRGAFTKSVLDHYGVGHNAAITGCPTLFINPEPQLGKLIASRVREPRRIAVTAGHQLWKHLGRIESSLTSILTACDGSYVGQSPFEMVALTRGDVDSVSRDTLIECRDYACPQLSLRQFSDWIRRHGNVFFDIPSWMEHYRKFDFVVGTRIHGVVLALQTGVPAMCIAHDSRTIELCTTMMIPFVHDKDLVDGFGYDELLSRFNFDPIAFDANRVELCRNYIDFLESNDLHASASLLAIASR